MGDDRWASARIHRIETQMPYAILAGGSESMVMARGKGDWSPRARVDARYRVERRSTSVATTHALISKRL